MNLGKEISNIRKEQGYKQKEFAVLCGISANTLCQIEKGHAFPHKGTLHTICRNLNISLEYLIISSLNGENFEHYKKQLFIKMKNVILEIIK